MQLHKPLKNMSNMKYPPGVKGTHQTFDLRPVKGVDKNACNFQCSGAYEIFMGARKGKTRIEDLIRGLSVQVKQLKQVHRRE